MTEESGPLRRPLPAGRSSGQAILEQGFGDRGESRVLKWAAVGAIFAHFLVFTAILRLGSTVEFELDPEQITVIRRYRPPEMPETEKNVRRRVASRVPIPDPTPDDPEPLDLDDVVYESELEPADTEFLVTAPTSLWPLGPANAVGIDTEGLEFPVLLEQVEPVYDTERARRGVQGVADLEIVIDEHGAVLAVRVINSTTDEELDQAAIDAVKQWTFVPGKLDGEAVPVRAVVTINFRIY